MCTCVCVCVCVSPNLVGCSEHVSDSDRSPLCAGATTWVACLASLNF